jgi:hypothetical protein
LIDLMRVDRSADIRALADDSRLDRRFRRAARWSIACWCAASAACCA